MSAGERRAAPLAALRVEPAALSDYLRRAAPGLRAAVEAAHKFAHGQSNPTFRLDLGDGRAMVLRAKPPGGLIQSAHMIDREFRVLRALRGSGVPVPRALHYCSDAAVVGAEFYVMEFVPGRVMSDPTLPDSPPGERRDMYLAMLDALVRIHSTDLNARGLTDFGRDGGRGFYARQIRTARRSQRHRPTRPA